MKWFYGKFHQNNVKIDGVASNSLFDKNTEFVKYLHRANGYLNVPFKMDFHKGKYGNTKIQITMPSHYVVCPK